MSKCVNSPDHQWPTVRRLLVLCSALLAAPSQAGQEWELISVTRGASWEVNQAKGALERNGKVLEGILNDKTDGKADYQIRIVLNGVRAEATFRSISENDQGTTLTGHLLEEPEVHENARPRADSAHQFVSLRRALPRCLSALTSRRAGSRVLAHDP